MVTYAILVTSGLGEAIIKQANAIISILIGNVSIPRSNRHGRKRPFTEKYDDLHVMVLRPYISVSYTEKYGDIRRKKRSFTDSVHEGRIRSPFFSVYDRIAPYTDTDIYDHM
jgi:hypothetical protein